MFDGNTALKVKLIRWEVREMSGDEWVYEHE